MSPGLVWLATPAAFCLLGAPLLSHPAYRCFSTPARAVLSGTVAAATLSFLMTLAALAGLPWSVPPLTLTTLAVCWALRVFLRKEASASPPPGDVVMPGAFLSAAAVAASLLATLSGAAGSSDMLLFWGPKAQAFAEARTIDAAFLTSPAAALMHPYYPPLVPNLEAFATMLAGRFPWSAATLTFPLLLGALALCLPSLLRSADRPFAPGAVSALVVSSLALLGAEADIAGNGDAPLWLFEILGIALLLAPPPIDTARLLLAGILFAGAATAKVEGLPFVLAAVLFFIVSRRRKGAAPRQAALLIAPALLALGAWLAFGLSRQVFRAYGEYGSFLDARWGRLPVVLVGIARSLWASGFALPWIVPLAVLLAARARPRGLTLAVAGALALFLTATYILPVPDPRPWIQWSAPRTLFPIAVLLALSAAGPSALGRASSAAATSSETPEIHSPPTKDAGR